MPSNFPQGRPRWPFTINKDDPQAQDLLAVYPMIHPGGDSVYDLGPAQAHGSAIALGTGITKWSQDPYGAPALFFDNTNLVGVPNLFTGLARYEATITAWCARADNGSTRNGPPVGFDSTDGESHYPFDGTNFIATFANARGVGIDVIGYYDWHLCSYVTGPTVGGVGTCYQNDVLMGTFASGSLANIVRPYIGGSGYGLANYQAMYGYVGEVRMYNRALTPSELAVIADRETRYNLYWEIGRRAFFVSPPPSVTAESGAYVLAGQATNFLRSRVLAGELGAYVLSGKDVSLTTVGKINADAASFLVTGQNVTFLLGRSLLADAGIFTLNGQDAMTLITRNLSAGVGVYIVDGKNASLLKILPSTGGGRVIRVMRDPDIEV